MRIGKHELALPILQGGMGVGVSMGGLAGAVAACGGMGTVSTADAGYLEADFAKNPFEANLRALRQEIGKAKEIAKGAGMVAVNAMVATVQYADAVRTAVAAGVDAVVFGHSHKYVQEEKGGVLWLNPGSCGPRRFHQEITMMTAEAEDGKIRVEKVIIPHGTA